MIKKSSFVENLFFAFGAQGVSLLLSVMTSLVVPKLLGIREFGYWQLFVFYSSYIGFFHFGLNDGIYLKYGGIKYENIDRPLIGSQFRLEAIVQSIVAIIIVLLTVGFEDESERYFVWITTAVNLVLNNLALFLGYIFQAANKTKIYSLSVILNKLFFIATIIIAIQSRINKFQIYILLYLGGKLISLIYCIYKARDIVFSQTIEISKIAVESFNNIKTGIKLMIANVSGSLIIGIGRVFLDNFWGIEIFGKVSFALSLVNFILLFISQISMVLFPALRQFEEEKLINFYKFFRSFLLTVLPAIFLLYIPIKIILVSWLPQYTDSLDYLAIMLPICLFNGNMDIICATYLKVLRKEKLLLKINVISLLFSTILSFIGAYYTRNVYVVIVFMVISTAVQNIIGFRYLSLIIGKTYYGFTIQSVIISLLFMIISYSFSNIQSFVLFFAVYILFILFNFSKVKSVVTFITDRVISTND